MIDIKINSAQEEILKEVIEIQLAHLYNAYSNKDEYDSIKRQFMDSHNSLEKASQLDLGITIDDLINEYESMIHEPLKIFQLPLPQLEIITLILAEYFEKHWDNQEDDFIDLCRKLVKLSDYLEQEDLV